MTRPLRSAWSAVPAWGVALMLAGCAAMWVRPQTPIRSKSLEAELVAPEGWMHFQAEDEAIILTRNGVALETISLTRLGVGDEFPNTDRTLREGMLTYELAEAVGDSVRLIHGVTNFAVLESAPAEVDGRSCFKLVYVFRAPDRVRRKSLEYGCMVDGHLYRLDYTAALQHYFDASVEQAEAVRRSLRFTRR